MQAQDSKIEHRIYIVLHVPISAAGYFLSQKFKKSERRVSGVFHNNYYGKASCACGY